MLFGSHGFPVPEKFPPVARLEQGRMDSADAHRAAIALERESLRSNIGIHNLEKAVGNDGDRNALTVENDADMERERVARSTRGIGKIRQELIVVEKPAVMASADVRLCGVHDVGDVHRM